MDIIAFAQLRNELERGNLENWFKSITSFCNYIYIYDQDSDDGSKDYYKKFDNCTVIESPYNNFEKESICKQELLLEVRKNHKNTDWIFWMDGDTILDGRLTNDGGCKLREELSSTPADGLNVGHYNLWRSDTYYRTDNLFDWLHDHGVVAFWKNVEYLNFPIAKGLHGRNHPKGFRNVPRYKDFALIHRGFATDKQIMDRLRSYVKQDPSSWPKGRSQINHTISRFTEEDGLQVSKLDSSILPNWLHVNDLDPRKLESIKDLYSIPFI